MATLQINRKFFFDQARRTLFDGSLSKTQVIGLTAILDEWEANYAKEDHRKLAYILGTIHHEVDRKFEPIEEYGKGKGKDYGKHLKYSRKPYPADMPLYYGRGLTQNTWYEIYEKMGEILGIDLLNHPELALQLDISVKMTFIGMTRGIYTGVKLSNYFAGTKENWKGARAIINGKDKADLIASYAQRYYACISMIPLA